MKLVVQEKKGLYRMVSKNSNATGIGRQYIKVKLIVNMVMKMA